MEIHAVLNFLAGYLTGSVLFSPLVARVLYGIKLPKNYNDLGATHTYFYSRKPLVYLLGALLDTLKGAFAFEFFGIPGAIGALIGHMWSIFYGFRGGRGASVAAYPLFKLSPEFIPLYLVYFFARLYFFRKESKIYRQNIDSFFKFFLALAYLISGKQNSWFVALVLILTDVKAFIEGEFSWRHF